MTAPERIRASGDLHPWWGSQFKCYPMPLQPMPVFKLAEYVRADLHDATKAQLATAVEALRACRATFIRCQWDEKSVAVESIDALLAEIEKGEPK